MPEGTSILGSTDVTLTRWAVKGVSGERVLGKFRPSIGSVSPRGTSQGSKEKEVDVEVVVER